MKLIDIHLAATPIEPKTYAYNVELLDYTSSWTLIHTGKFFANAGEQDIQLELDDILVTNHYYRGGQSIVPVIDSTTNSYIMPKDETGIVKECYRNSVRVSAVNGSDFATVTKKFWFTPENVFGYSRPFDRGMQIPARVEGLMPHIPANAPSGFSWSVLLWNGNNMSVTVNSSADGTETESFTAAANTAYNIRLEGATKSYAINGRDVAVVDSCTKPYYLIWLDNMGGLQCQGFLKSSEFSRNYQNKTAIDSKNSEWKITSTTTGNWTLKSQNLSDKEYRIYGEMFNSPFIVLLDMANNRLHYVNITDTDYSEKHRTRNDSKPVFFQVKVSSAEKLRI